MTFRERPEYAERRTAVFQLYGRKCVMCGHGVNITAHHVKAVNTYPNSRFSQQTESHCAVTAIRRSMEMRTHTLKC